ncbi:MAG: sugar phosphate isomerase/epimerase, partial [Syntrophomonadaceae bacterium]|nr:sugar phosphate isomerase/epimerase [Syntrophomonadaceae bacterium]
MLDSTFSGMASYMFPQLLAPVTEMRDISVQYFKHAMDMTAAMGTD